MINNIELIKPLLINSKINIKSFRKNIEISCTKGETILDSMINSEYKIDHSCMTGTCGLCKMNLYEGEVIDKNQIVYNGQTKEDIEKYIWYNLSRKPEFIKLLEIV